VVGSWSPTSDQHVEQPLYLEDDRRRPAVAAQRSAAGGRKAILRFVCKIKMSQDKDAR